MGKRRIELRTTSDTEVLLHYYRIYGEGCVDHFEGMWAFAIWDEARKSLILCRDRFGEKPLFLHETSDGTYFASEIKALAALCVSVSQLTNNVTIVPGEGCNVAGTDP